MTELSDERDREPEIASPSIWSYIISVSVSIVLIISICRFVFNLVPERVDLFETEKVANEAYKKYSYQLEALSEKSAKEIKAAGKES